MCTSNTQDGRMGVDLFQSQEDEIALALEQLIQREHRESKNEGT